MRLIPAPRLLRRSASRWHRVASHMPPWGLSSGNILHAQAHICALARFSHASLAGGVAASGAEPCMGARRACCRGRTRSGPCWHVVPGPRRDLCASGSRDRGGRPLAARGMHQMSPKWSVRATGLAAGSGSGGATKVSEYFIVCTITYATLNVELCAAASVPKCNEMAPAHCFAPFTSSMSQQQVSA